MVNSTYALRETTSKANSLKNRRASSSSSNNRSSTPSIYSSAYFYTAEDPQYHQFESPKKTTKKTKKTNSSTSTMNRKPKKQGKKSKTKAKNKTSTVPPPSALYDSSSRIRQPNANDVLLGRGGSINNYPGNIAFRSLVSEQKNAYNLSTNKNQKSVISQSIVDMIRGLDPPGRFLMKDESVYGGGLWVEVDNAKALSKTSQALREGAPTIRALAAADNKDVDSKSLSAKRSLGKRKRASYKRSAAAKAEKEAGRDHDEDQEETQSRLHPLIVPMSNGHRGKQLIPRSTTEEEEKQEVEHHPQQHQHQQQRQEEADQDQQQQPQKTQGKDSTSTSTITNPCVSFDEDHDHDDDPEVSNAYNEGKRLKTMILDTKAETPPPLEIPTPLDNSRDTHTTSYLYSQSQQLPHQPPSSFSRAHSLLSSEMNGNGLNESFHGDENFVNPFLNESAVLADFYNEWNRDADANDAFDFSRNDSTGSNKN